MNRTLVLGVGNTLLADEGAGVHAMEHLRRHYADFPNTEFVDAGTLSFTLVDAIAGSTNLIIFDATQLNADPGTVRVFEGRQLDDFLSSGKRSVHEVGFADLMDIARLQDCLPQNRALIGIQPEVLGWGDSPGKAVSDAIPLASELAAALIQQWAMVPSLEVAAR